MQYQDTSRQARDSIAAEAPSIAEEIFGHILQMGGCTCDELEAITGRPHQTVSARIRELAQLGRIEKTDQRRKTRSGRSAIVWATPAPPAPPAPYQTNLFTEGTA